MAGLTFARVLQRAGWSVTVFERALALDSPYISGDICVPDALGVLRKLGLDPDEISQLCQAADVQDSKNLPQQHLLLLLARSLHSGTLRPGSRVIRVFTDDMGRARCHLDGNEVLGPFDLIVCAHGQFCSYEICVNTCVHDGVLSSNTRMVGAAAEPGAVAVIGDARWVRKRWWDLGTARRARGANVALLDGLDLGERVLACAEECAQLNLRVLNRCLDRYALQPQRKALNCLQAPLLVGFPLVISCCIIWILGVQPSFEVIP